MLLFSTSSLRLGVWWAISAGLVCEIGRPDLEICPPKNSSWDVVLEQQGARGVAARPGQQPGERIPQCKVIGLGLCGGARRAV
jgi:hypothetical protein